MRLIDADALRGNVPSTSVDIFENCRNCRLLDEDQVKEIIDDAPTIDAEPVRHGHWIIHVDELFPADSTQECSACHGEEWLGIKHENYCPNCGAKMDNGG